MIGNRMQISYIRDGLQVKHEGVIVHIFPAFIKPSKEECLKYGGANYKPRAIKVPRAVVEVSEGGYIIVPLNSKGSYFNYTIIDKEINQMEKFTKSDLKDGMVVEYRNGRFRIVIGEQLIGRYDTENLKPYDEDLKHTSKPRLDIIAVYSVGNGFKITQMGSSSAVLEHLNLIWSNLQLDNGLRVGGCVESCDSIVNVLSKGDVSEVVEICDNFILVNNNDNLFKIPHGEYKVCNEVDEELED